MKPINSAAPKLVFSYIYANSLVSDIACNYTTIIGKYKKIVLSLSLDGKPLLNIFFRGENIRDCKSKELPMSFTDLPVFVVSGV